MMAFACAARMRCAAMLFGRAHKYTTYWGEEKRRKGGREDRGGKRHVSRALWVIASCDGEPYTQTAAVPRTIGMPNTPYPFKFWF